MSERERERERDSFEISWWFCTVFGTEHSPTPKHDLLTTEAHQQQTTTKELTLFSGCIDSLAKDGINTIMERPERSLNGKSWMYPHFNNSLSFGLRSKS